MRNDSHTPHSTAPDGENFMLIWGRRRESGGNTELWLRDWHADNDRALKVAFPQPASQAAALEQQQKSNQPDSSEQPASQSARQPRERFESGARRVQRQQQQQRDRRKQHTLSDGNEESESELAVSLCRSRFSRRLCRLCEAATLR